jgi:hypothetical protein
VKSLDQQEHLLLYLQNDIHKDDKYIQHTKLKPPQHRG